MRHSGYNLVTGLGTPVANRLVPDLVAYQGPATSYADRPSGRCRMRGSADPTGSGGLDDVFSVFDALAVTGVDFGAARIEMPATGLTGRADPTAEADRDGVTLESLTYAGVPIVPGSGTSAAGSMPLDSNAARDAVLADWVSSPIVARRPTRQTVVAGPRAIKRTSLALGGPRRTPVLQATFLDWALEERRRHVRQAN